MLGVFGCNTDARRNRFRTDRPTVAKSALAIGVRAIPNRIKFGLADRQNSPTDYPQASLYPISFVRFSHFFTYGKTEAACFRNFGNRVGLWFRRPIRDRLPHIENQKTIRPRLFFGLTPRENRGGDAKRFFSGSNETDAN